MDPLSITLGVLAIVSATTKAVGFANTYLKKVRGDNEAAGELLDQLKALESSPKALENLPSSEPRPLFSSASALVTNTSSCEDKLLSLCQRLEEAENRRSRFQWPLSPKDHGDTLQEIRDMAQWVQFSVSIESVTILSKTSNEFIELLSHQLQALQLIQKLKEDTETANRVMVDIKDKLADSSVVEHRRNVLDWLSEISQAGKHNSVRSLHTHGTCQWLLKHPVFQQWNHRPPGRRSVLWCHGPPGSGKTLLVYVFDIILWLVVSLVLTRFSPEIIEHLRHDEGVGVAYIYFDYRVHLHLSLEEMTASLLKQLASAQSELPRALDDFYDSFKAGSNTAQWEPLMKTLSLTSKAFAKTFVVVDALDECDTYTLNGFLKLVGALQTCSRVLVASRDHQGSITNAFQTTPQIQNIAQSSDIRSYILDTLTRNNGFGSLGAAFENEIADKITRSSHHM